MPSRKERIQLERRLQQKSGLQLNKRIYSVYDCSVYSIKGQSDKLLKLVCLPIEETNLRDRLAVLRYIIKRNNPGIVKVFQLRSFTIRGGNLKGRYYFYTMEKLRPLSIKRKNIIIDHLAEMVETGIPTKVKIPNKLLKLVQQVKSIRYPYWDMHSGNIMEDKLGRAKFIDLEGFLPEGFY